MHSDDPGVPKPSRECLTLCTLTIFFRWFLISDRKKHFLERTAPDYRTVEFINRTLSPETSGSSGGNVMVFFRHFYYFRVRFVDGTPEYSWLMDPVRYNDADKLRTQLHEMNAR